MKYRTLPWVVVRWLVVFTLAVNLIVSRGGISAQGVTLAVYVEREIELDDLGLAGSGSLAYSPAADVFYFLAAGPGLMLNSMAIMDRLEHIISSAAPTFNPAQRLVLAFNPLTNSLYGYDPISGSLLQIPAQSSAVPGPQPLEPPAVRAHDLTGAVTGLLDGAAFDPGTGRLFALDPARKRVLVLSPDKQANYDAGQALAENRAAWIDLTGPGVSPLHGLAYNAANQHLYTLSTAPLTILEFSTAGDFIASADVSTSGLRDPQSMVIAPSGDHTDDPANQSIYIADPGRNVIVEFAFDRMVPNALELSTAFALVNTIPSSTWVPPSPDPVGLDVFPNGSLLISDSEVDELPLYDRANVYQAQPNGTLQSTCNTLRFSNEPTGVAIDAVDGIIFFSDDVKDRVFKVNLGPDGIYCTNDDSVSSINTATYGVTDPEGVAYGAGRLFLTEGLGKEIVVIRPGNNGIFDGGAQAGDDTYTHFDTLVMGLRDPEGIGYHPGRNSLFIVSRNDNIMVETTLEGTELNVFSLRTLHPVSPGGVGVGPGSQNPNETVIYIADRGTDNNNNPNENDGVIYEVSIGDAPAPIPTQTATAVPPAATPTTIPPTAVPTATNTRVPRPTESIPPADQSIFLPLLLYAAP